MKILFISTVVFLAGFSVEKQAPVPKCEKWAGIYSTQAAYLEGKFSDSVCLDLKKNAIRQGSFNRLVMNTGKIKKIFKGGTTYGYFNGEDKYRYFEMKDLSGYFKVLDTTGLVIYSRKGYSYRYSTIGYYYSKNAADTIRRLSVKNLRSDFSKQGFVDEVDKMKDLSSSNGSDLNTIYRKYYR